MYIRRAVQSDQDALLRLTAACPMDGEISIRIDRYPDFFGLLKQRGDYIVFVAEKDSQIIGSFSAAREQFNVNGFTEDIFYAGDLKVHPDFRKTRTAYCLVKSMLEYIQTTGVDLVFGTAAYGNAPVSSFFDGKAGFPQFEYIGTFNVYQILPKDKLKKNPQSCIEFSRGTEHLSELYNDFYKKYCFAKTFQDSSFHNTKTVSSIFNKEVKASLTMADVEDIKQNVLIGIPQYVKGVFTFLRLVNKAKHIFNLPETGRPVKILYVRAFQAAPGFESHLERLISYARKYSFEKNYSFLTVGIHERDPLNGLFKKYARFTFKSLGFLTSISGRNEVVSRIKNGISFEDYSLV